MATKATPKTTKETPKKNRPPLLIERPVSAAPADFMPWACAIPEVPGVLLVIPIGARITLNARSIADSSCSLAAGLGMQLQVGDAKMLGLTFTVAVRPTIPNTPIRTAKAR